jgi:hypothetical protein
MFSFQGGQGMSDIFISYASQDRERARELAEALKQFGWSVWWDRQIPPGKTFDQVIEEELTAARCVTVLWSKDSVASRWVKTEASAAAEREILVPVLIEDVKIPFEFQRIQAARLVDWRRGTPHQDFDLLVKAVERTLGQPSKPPTSSWQNPLNDISSIFKKSVTFGSTSWRHTFQNAQKTTRRILMGFAIVVGILMLIGLLVNSASTPVYNFVPPAGAQYCCDGFGVRRCPLAYQLPVGSQCVCPGQGYGTTCP